MLNVHRGSTKKKFKARKLANEASMAARSPDWIATTSTASR
jgi:hypothetical protein